ncbi:hypothetical protein [Shewanella sp. NIFS-20-20]|uniref:hypothetical protein n=1 Tax=Shewanella sp. NIFS-20-20 TaxID=2853806 RepID=UPI001C4522CF|nr:hypothetical protein [Shewanella sp. NIFS-20-20]MBV7315419.1 hypothetical protein [Shewanella sp. NIFS-20-20]
MLILSRLDSQEERENRFLLKKLIKSKSLTLDLSTKSKREIHSLISEYFELTPNRILKSNIANAYLELNDETKFTYRNIKKINDEILESCKLNILDKSHFSWLNQKDSLRTLICWYFIRTGKDINHTQYAPTFQTDKEPPISHYQDNTTKVYETIIGSYYLDNSIHRFNSIIYFLDLWETTVTVHYNAKTHLIECLKNELREYESYTLKDISWLVKIDARDIDWLWNSVSENLYSNHLLPITLQDKYECSITAIHFAIKKDKQNTDKYLKRLRKSLTMRNLRLKNKNLDKNIINNHHDKAIQELKYLADSLKSQLDSIQKNTDKLSINKKADAQIDEISERNDSLIEEIKEIITAPSNNGLF